MDQLKKIISILCMMILLGNIVHADQFKTVTLGADLSKEQRQKMLSFFQVTEEDVEIIEITNEEERQYLKGIAPEQMLGTRSISSAYVEPLAEGKGLQVETSNLTFVDEKMLSNAMITAGIKDAKIIAAAPFKVSGTAALTGVMKAFEKATGKKINPEAKETANREMMITGNLAEKVGKDKAANFVNEVKVEVIERGGKLTADTARSIIEKVAERNGITLTEEEKQYLVDLMERIKGLDLKINDIQKQLQNIHDKIQQGIEENRGFFQKIMEQFKKLFDWIGSFFGSKVQA